MSTSNPPPPASSGAATHDPEKLLISSSASTASSDSSIRNSKPSVELSKEANVDSESAAASPPRRTLWWMPWRTYGSSNPLRWRQLPPVPDSRPPSDEPSANIFSVLTFAWMGPLMSTGYLRPLEPNDIPLVPPNRTVAPLAERLLKSFQRRHKRGDKHPLLFALNETFFWEWWTAGICRLVADVLLAVNPYLLKYLIAFATDSYNAAARNTKGPAIGRGVGLAIGIALIQGVASVLASQTMYRSAMVGAQGRAAAISLIFDKSMKISARARAEGEGWSNGRITNLMGTDTYRIDQAASWSHLLWTSPVLIIVTLVLLIVNLSYSALAGFALLVLGVPVLSWAVRVLAEKRKKMNLVTDERVRLTQEILTGVKFVKFFGWEESFLKRLQGLRNAEIRAVQFLLGVRSGITAVGLSLPVFAAMLAFITYSLTDNSLNPASVFSSLALFNSLRMPLNILPMVIALAVDAWVSLKRIQEFLLAEEIVDAIQFEPEQSNAIEVGSASFTWEQVVAPDGTAASAGKSSKRSKSRRKSKDVKKSDSTATTPPSEPFVLPPLSLSVSRSHLLAVVGSVGSGKTSLLAALAGDMRLTSGTVTLSSQLAYCPQYAWIQNATVRENILFGKPYDPTWYDSVVKACCLDADFAMLPNGDMTEIGERGITVSGGQKQRINIARAIYYNAEIVLMDDPLSAVDAHVGKVMFDEAICGLLKGKCRVLATHQLHVLERCDAVVWMEGGRVRATGTFEELMSTDEGFQHMLREISTAKEKAVTRSSESDSESEDEEEIKEIKRIASNKPAQGPGKGLMQAEERAVDSVSWSVYKAYIAASGSLLVAPLLMFNLIATQASNIMTTMWLSYWTSRRFGLTTGQYIAGFASLGVFQSLLMFTFAFGLTIAGTRSSRTLFTRAMKQTLRAPMAFFDTTPIGRIINRFSKDVDVMDNNITDAMRMYFLTLAMVSSVIVLIIVYFYWFAIAVVPLAAFLIFAAGYYRASAREVKRHEAVLRSHVFSRFGESLTGVASIRAYGLRERFQTAVDQSIDSMNGAYFITFANQRWLSLRLDVVGVSLVFVTAILVVTSRFRIDPSISGVVLSYILQIVAMIQWCVRQLAEVENAMNSTERLHHYGTQLPHEAPLGTSADVHLPVEWLEHGEVRFVNASMRYRPGLPLVLRSLDLVIPAGSRVGIVGRTGAGKSSITSALFRLTELASGQILIDGVDISTLGLHQLRTKLAIIPQDPTLFRGTVRSNLDPFDEHTNDRLLEALEAAKLDMQLGATVEEEGLNFSLGQRQQMALARALVRRARVVVADEATSSVDQETDRMIQRTMREGFKGRTLLCVAHRLRTIIGYDIVVVMDNGRIVEVDRPRALWERTDGIFRGMCDRSGIKLRDFEDFDK